MHKVPKFIRRQPKIVWFFTFKQFVYVAMTGAACFVSYFTWGKTNLFLFIIFTVTVMGAAFAFAFLRIGGKSLLTFLGNFFSYTVVSKKYLWKKKRLAFKTKIKKEVEEKTKETSPLQVVEGSRLKDLSIEIETKK